MTLDQALQIAYPDRFSPPTEAEPEPWAKCESCGADIYPGENCISLNGSYVCDDISCLIKYTGGVVTVAGEQEENQ